jgi:2-desacetyl-2-hydroxyethyl bacteriochlorophyllide A dehydrogenase
MPSTVQTSRDLDSFRLRDDGAVAFWATGPGVGELRASALPEVAPGEVLVRTLFSGVSRGTEGLVIRGEVPESEWERMRSPFQDGEFPFPVKYGYLNVGVVERGPDALIGRTVFTLFPHQSVFVVPEDAVAPVPNGVPPRRAVLAGAVETAINVLWDAGPRVGDAIAIVGAGMIGGAIATLATQIPGVDVTLIDIEPDRRRLAAELGVGFAHPEDAALDYDVVIEASGTGQGLAVALRVAATDGEVVVASWYGSMPQQIDLGADFHSRRITLRASQVGEVAQARRGRRTRRQRLDLALRLLENRAFDNLLGDDSSWSELPSVMTALADGTSGSLCHTIDWSRR